LSSIGVALTTFAVIALAELPDKTALASLVLGTRYRAAPVLIGIGAGFAVQVVLAVAAGSLLRLLPHRLLQAVVAALFLAGAAVLIFSRRSAEEAAEESPRNDRFWPAAWASFAVVAVAEFGDLTQVLIANLVARYHDPIAVGVAALVAMWAVSACAVIGGKALLRLVPVTLVTRAAAAVMIGLAGFTLAEAFG
jgi:putative Ca2+/H+ antiporter (TMEM165/GDT1 family)